MKMTKYLPPEDASLPSSNDRVKRLQWMVKAAEKALWMVNAAEKVKRLQWMAKAAEKVMDARMDMDTTDIIGA